MSVGVNTPTIPVANDIIQGEFIAYANYGTPLQTVLGSTNGGCVVDINRNIKYLPIDGVYGPVLDSNGVPLVRHIEFIASVTLQQMYLKYFHKKTISNCESDGTWESKDWAGTGGTYAAETSIVNTGLQSAKCTGDTENYGIHEVFASSKDLTAYANSEVAGTSDYIGFGIYITSANKTALGSNAKIRLSIHKDIEGTETNAFYYDIAGSSLTADEWNIFKIAKSSFSEAGTASWSAVTGISFKFATAAPSSSCTFYVDAIDLIQNQSLSSIVGLNASNFDYTDETTYRLIKPDLEITSEDYLENITLISQKMDGKMVKIVLRNCLNDGNIDTALEQKSEIVNGTTFTSHYEPSAGTTTPLDLYEYVA